MLAINKSFLIFTTLLISFFCCSAWGQISRDLLLDAAANEVSKVLTDAERKKQEQLEARKREQEQKKKENERIKEERRAQQEKVRQQRDEDRARHQTEVQQQKEMQRLQREAESKQKQAEIQQRRETQRLEREEKKEALRLESEQRREALREQRQQEQDEAMRRCQVVTDWLSDTQDLPADVVRAAQVGKAAVNDIPIESWLLIDSRSQRLFGKPFDQVDQASLANFAYVPSNCRAQTQYSKLLFKSNFIQHLQQPQTHAKALTGLSKIRYMSQQAATLPIVLKSLNPNEGDVYKYEAAHREWEAIKPYLSAQENEHLANEFRQTKSRVVQPILRQSAD